MSEEKQKRKYLISSFTLIDSNHFLNQQPEESFHFMTGVIFDSVIVLERIIPVKAEYKSIGGWKSDPYDAIKKLFHLDNFEHALLGTMHIHPGIGKNSTLPSCIDYECQESLEKGGYKAIMGIFSRDGYLRFFSVKNNFEIQIYGAGVVTIDEQAHLFKITATNNISWSED